MAIFDCFQYFNEDHIADLRFNILNKFVDKFVIVESTVNHQGKSKKLHFDINKYKKFKNKINYIIVDDTPENIKKFHEGGESLVEQHQRNSITKGLKNANDNDLIILSDVDEIPDLNKLNEYDSNKYAVFSQKMFMYKLNFLNLKENNWHGSKICLKKNFKSPQWVRNLKFKQYPFWRIDTLFSNTRYINLEIIKDGGWHFTNLMTAEKLYEKLSNFGHHDEFELSRITVNDLKKKMDKKEVFFNHFVDKEKYKERWNYNYKLKKIGVEKLPKYLQSNDNQLKLKDWFD